MKRDTEKRVEVGHGWAWAIRDLSCRRETWLICNWAANTRQSLERETKPSPEARPVYVKLRPVHAKQSSRAKRRRK